MLLGVQLDLSVQNNGVVADVKQSSHRGAVSPRDEVLRAPESSCSSAHRVTLSALGQGRGAVPECNLCSD